GWPEDRPFWVPEEALREFRTAVDRGAELEAGWRKRLDAYRKAEPERARDLERALAGELPAGWESLLPTFTPGHGAMATREASGTVINKVAAGIPNLIGGSGDLDPSTKTSMKGKGDFQSPLSAQKTDNPPTQGTAGGIWGYAGRNIHFGVREHGMAAILNGM